MELNFTLEHSFTEQQSIKINKVATLIGENGSGKSSVLHSIFSQKLSGKAYKDHKIICFSSGQNERFSGDFINYLSKTKFSESNLQFSCFYFDKSWSRLLIFLATTLKSSGKVRNFLVNSGYTIEDNKVDISTNLKISFRVDAQYVRQIQDALLKEARGETDTIRQTAFHQSLESFVDKCIQEKYDFDEPIKKNLINLSHSKLLNVSFDTDRVEEGNSPIVFDPEIGFFIRAAHNSYFLDRETASLAFSKNLELSALSDGEYQILFLYSLIDLFDDDETIFILDEADSHLHYKNIEKFWNTLSSIKGRAVSTTHLLDSIYCVGIDNIRVLKQGKIHLPSESAELLGRLSQLSNIKKSELKALTFYEKIVLIDDLNDWLIFKELYKRAKSPFGLSNEFHEDTFNQFAVIKVPSDWSNHNCYFAESKLLWVEDFMKFCAGQSTKTKHIYLICDRDNLPIDGIGSTSSPLIVKGVKAKNRKGLQSSVLAWHRREIENYLLSFSALVNFGVIEHINNDYLAKCFHLQEGDSGDNHGIRALDVKHIINPLIETIGMGKDPIKIEQYINKIKPEEISMDITNMYNFITGKL